MCFLKYFKILSLLIITKSCDSSTDERFSKLEACLTLAGIPADHITHRDNGKKYTELNWQWNSLNGYMKPRAYIEPTTASDVQKAVICCRKLKIRIVPRGGGHSYAKNSFGDSNSLIVDMSKINSVLIDNKGMTCDIGAGARNGFVNYWLSTYNFLVPVGICPTVGIAGLALGGGWGYFTRMYGLTSDNIVELEMVDAKGRLLKINKNSNTVTKFKFKMYPIPANMAHGIYEFSLTDFSMVYRSWQFLVQITEKTMLNLGTLIIVLKTKIIMEIFFINTDEAKMKAADIIDLVNSFQFPDSIKKSVKDLSYTEFLLRISQYYSKETLTDVSQLNMTRHIESGWKKVKSFYVNKILDHAEGERLQLLVISYVKHCKLAFLQNGGAMNKFARTETAFVHRKNMYDIQMWCYSPDGDKQEVRQAMSTAMATFYEESKNEFILNHKESYQNYLDLDIHDSLDRYYKENLEKLIKIKIEFDPDNVFHHPHSIPNKNQFTFVDTPLVVIDEDESSR